MREFQLRSSPTILTTLKEPPKKGKKRKVKWQRISFLIVAFALLAYISVQVYIRLAIIQADAQLVLHKQIIHYPTDVKISALYIEEGQEIKEGDTLFKYTIPIDDQITTSEINVDKPIEWILKERINTQKQIELKRIQKLEIENQVTMRKGMHANKKELILLGSYNDRNEYEELSIQINRLESESVAISDEIAYLQKLLYRLNLENSNYKRIETRKKEIFEESHYQVAQMDGIIGQINYNENEICYRKEELLTIHKTKDIRIKAFFDPSDMKYLHEGDVVDISYPDKTTSQGVITNFHIATYALPEEFQKKYEPTERNIVADVRMLDTTFKPLMSYYKMNVLITKNRYKL
jgi:multidrug resistance efflux pump